jgi:hypothetical protein
MAGQYLLFRRFFQNEIKHIYNFAGLLAHRDGWPFDRPITKADAPDYHKIIAKPMDLCTIR